MRKRLDYRRGYAGLHNENLLQCDICERFACAECLGVYDILSGYDFVCHECASSSSGRDQPRSLTPASRMTGAARLGRGRPS